MKKTLYKIIAQIAGKVDTRDVFAFGGLAMVCCGVAQIYAPAAWIIGGIAFIYLGMS